MHLILQAPVAKIEAGDVNTAEPAERVTFREIS